MSPLKNNSNLCFFFPLTVISGFLRSPLDSDKTGLQENANILLVSFTLK